MIKKTIYFLLSVLFYGCSGTMSDTMLDAVEQGFKNQYSGGTAYYIGVDTSFQSSEGIVENGEQEFTYPRNGDMTFSAQIYPVKFVGFGLSYANGMFDTDISDRKFKIQSNSYSVFGTLKLKIQAPLIFGLAMTEPTAPIAAFLAILDPYVSGGGSFVSHNASFDGMNNKDEYITCYYEIGVSTMPIYHVSANVGRRYTEKKTYEFDDMKYNIGGDSWVAGISIVF